MLQNVSLTPSRRTLEFGIYRDGANNLDAIQEAVVNQAVRTSAGDSRIQFTVQDTTATHPGALRQAQGDTAEGLHTDSFTISDGTIGHVNSTRAYDMSDESNLARFVAKTLDNAEASGAKQTWIDLVDHGGGDGGGLQTSDGKCMSMPGIARAIADGVAMHARAHPEDAARTVDGVVANQCLMDTMGFADALSHAGVKWLAASPETMLAPGVPSSVAHAIAEHQDDPRAMAAAVVFDVMNASFDGGFFGAIRPAAAFDVLDLNPAKIARAETAIKDLNDDLASGAKYGAAVRGAVREDVRSVAGMVRFPEATRDMPWHADRPAIAVYDALAGDARLSPTLRDEARTASAAVRSLVLAHRESSSFGPFHGADYSDAAGPTVHLPTSRAQIDPWAANGIAETDNAFYRAVDGAALSRALA
ncbi:MAG: hypothetical protein JO199_12985 [Candidatus Eremiobacteraeota bacterium]|nr:hypothetical protein [Candidatus Eremiobacteraeota bacterium]